MVTKLFETQVFFISQQKIILMISLHMLLSYTFGEQFKLPVCKLDLPAWFDIFFEHTGFFSGNFPVCFFFGTNLFFHDIIALTEKIRKVYLTHNTKCRYYNIS